MQGLEDGHLVAVPDEVARGAQAGRAAAHDGHLLARGRGDVGEPDLARARARSRRRSARDSRCPGLELVAQDAAALALSLLRADPAGDGRQDVVLADLGRGLEVVARDDELDEVLDLHPDRAARDALGRGALEAAHRLRRRPQDGQALVDLLEVRPPELGRLLGHVLAGDLDPLLVRQRLGRRWRS